MVRAWHKLFRSAAAAVAFLLKVAIEERLGYMVELISDDVIGNAESALNLTGARSLYSALASGDLHIYPEVRRARLHDSML